MPKTVIIIDSPHDPQKVVDEVVDWLVKADWEVVKAFPVEGNELLRVKDLLEIPTGLKINYED